MKTTRREFAKYVSGAMAAVLLAGKGAFAAAKPKSSLTPSQKFVLSLVRHQAKLPVGMQYLDVAGAILFPMYAASGGLSTDAIFYLFKPSYGRSTGAAPFLGVRVPCAILGGLSDKDIEQYAVTMLSEAIQNFPELSQLVAIAGDDLSAGWNRHPIIADGGDMPRPSV